MINPQLSDEEMISSFFSCWDIVMQIVVPNITSFQSSGKLPIAMREGPGNLSGNIIIAEDEIPVRPAGILNLPNSLQ